ncbi:uncharacterized protein LOC114579686 [Dendrobium catenatum]|uniref:Uncharacterized protein n=1 Tax=Dendrobium catenatum TaxID=906689 RepID=A0A2I0WTH0_9ASPA|nr:uncharacterized protein LOC114579686 [Dendrobium catenatum]PKU78951.1 hypothetical protein MA16_Dca000295 [Dendrobium catenatum]
MEVPKAIVSVSSHRLDLAPQATESPISALLYDVSQQVQDTIQNMLKMNTEIEQSSGDIVEEIEKSKESAGAKSKILEEEKDRYQKAAMAVLQMLGGTDIP